MEKVLVISSQLTNINKVRLFLEEVYREFTLNKTSFNHVFIGVSEVVNNAIVHGNRLNPNRKVFIRLNLCGNQLNIEVEDEGEGFCDSSLLDPTIPENIKSEHGRGIFILRQITDELVFKEGGRKVVLIFTIPE